MSSLSFDGTEFIYLNKPEWGQMWTLPCIVKGGTNITGQRWMSGFMVDAGVEVVNFKLDSYTSYTVPDGKDLVLMTTNKGQTSSYYAGSIRIDNDEIIDKQNYGTNYFPIIVKSGLTLSVPENYTNFTGYLK